MYGYGSGEGFEAHKNHAKMLLLPAFRAEIEQHQRWKAWSTSQVRLTKLQLEFLRFTLEKLSTSDVDTKGCELAYDGIRTVVPELAAQILILLQKRYQKWLTGRTSVRSIYATISSLSNLVDKLQPHAQEQLLFFRRQSDDCYTRSKGLTFSVRTTHDFLTRLAQFSRLVRDNGLDYVVADMSAMDHAFSVRLKTLQEAQTIFDSLVSAAYDVDRTIPDERFALFDRL